MSTLHLSTFALGAISNLTNIFNLSISTAQIAEIWHKAIITLNPAGTTTSAWTTTSARTGAQLVYCSQRRKRWKILTQIHFNPAQHGFRQKHSTCTALSTITADISAGFSRKKPAHRTVLVALDLKDAIDNVDHQQLLYCVYNTNIPATIRRFFNNHIQNRRAKVHFRQKESKSRKVKTGVVQGGVLSPALFNYYLAEFPTPPPNIKFKFNLTLNIKQVRR